MSDPQTRPEFEHPEPQPESPRASTVGRSLRVLVVDEKQDAAMGLSLLLRAFGHVSRLTAQRLRRETDTIPSRRDRPLR
jgi:hypothetical protein